MSNNDPGKIVVITGANSRLGWWIHVNAPRFAFRNTS